MTRSSASRLKLIGAVLLIVAAVLPQYTCVQYRAPDGALWQSIPSGADSSRYQRVVERHYAFETFAPGRPESWLAVVAFAWPVGVIAVRRRNRWPVLNAVLWGLEPLLALGSGYLILLFSSFGQRAIGGWTGVAACLLYLVAWVMELAARFRKAPA